MKGVIDLARARLVTAGIVGDLHMADAVSKALEGRYQVTLHDLHVVKIILDLEVVRFHPGHYPLGMLGRGQVEGRHVAPVDRLDDQRNPRIRQLRGGIVEIVGKGPIEMIGIAAGRRQARQAIDGRAIEGLGIVDGRIDTQPEFIDAIGQAAYAPLATGPIAGRQVEQRLDNARLLESGGDLLLVMLIWRDIFDGPEAVFGGLCDPFEKGAGPGTETIDWRQTWARNSPLNL
jgi:hypothetical protein